MALFGKKKTAEIIVSAPMTGKCIALSEVPDEAFAQGFLGKGMAIIPSDGKVVSPIDGKITTVFETGHAVGLTTDDGMEMLIHVGLDTVTLKGGPFKIHAKDGAKVKKGDLLLEADLEAIAAAGLETVTPVLVCNPDDYKEIDCTTGKNVNALDEVMKVIK